MATPEIIDQPPPTRRSLQDINADYTERYGFHDAENYLYKAPKGLTRELVEKISEFKNEPQWMREFRLKALDHFLARPMPTWGSPMLAEVDFDDIHYFVRASERAERSWDDVPEDVKKTFDRLGIPEAERKFLAGVGAQYESEVVYHQVNEELEEQGVIFIGHGHRAARARGPRRASTSGRSSRRTTTSSPRSTAPCGRAARSSTCRRASTSRCRCRPTSASTRRTWASSSGRSSSPTRAPTCTTSRAAPRRRTRRTRCTPPSSS